MRERAAGPSRSRPRTGRRRGLGPRARVAARECCARRPRQDEPRRARVWRRRRARRATTQPQGDLETRAFALALTKYPYAKGVYSGGEGKRNHPRALAGERDERSLMQASHGFVSHFATKNRLTIFLVRGVITRQKYFRKYVAPACHTGRAHVGRLNERVCA